MLGGQYQMATYRQGKVYPKRLVNNEENLTLAQELIYVFEVNQNKNKEHLNEELKGVDSLGFHPKLVQGMAKLLTDQAEFTSLSAEDMPSLREKVFDQAADYWKSGQGAVASFTDHQSAILIQAGYGKQDSVKSWLYSDLESNQVLVAAPKKTPEDLIAEYNLEQVRSLFLSATSMRLEIALDGATSLRQLLQSLKFFGLLFEICHQSKTKLVLEVEGPQAILEHARSYGVEMANFFPSLLLLTCPWEMEAKIKRKGVSRLFTLQMNQKNPYKSKGQIKGVWWNEKVTALVARFAEKYSSPLKASLSQEVIQMKKETLLPDIEVKKGRKKAYVELVRYLSEAKKNWFLAQLEELPKNYYFAIKIKGKKKEELEKLLGQHLISYSSELTAPALKKLMD